MFLMLYSIFIFTIAMFGKILSRNRFTRSFNLILVFVYVYFAYSDSSNTVIIGLLFLSICINLAVASYMLNDNLAIVIKKILRKWKSLFKCEYSYSYYIGKLRLLWYNRSAFTRRSLSGITIKCALENFTLQNLSRKHYIRVRNNGG